MRKLVFATAFALAAACAHYPVNPPLTQPPSLSTGYRWATSTIPKKNDGTFVILTFSGGGTRAAGLSFATLEQLAKTKMADGSTLLDHVDVISSVSGGSFTAMEYGMRGKAMLNDFVPNFLQKSVEGELFKAAFSPRGLVRLLFSPNFHRIDIAAEVYDRILFHDKTYADLLEQQHRENRPLIIANATELEIGAHFEWTQDQFDPICSDLSQVHVARSVAASSAFPILLPAMVLNKYDRSVCNYQEPPWTHGAMADDYANPSRPRYATELRGYLDPERKFLHLIDGGIADNIGLRGPFHALISTDTFVPATPTQTGFTLLPLINDTPGFRHLDRVMVIVINAGTSGPVSLDKTAAEPSLIKVLGGISGTPMDNYSFDSIQQLVDLLANRSRGRIRYYPVLISFPLLRDDDVKKVVNKIGTSFDALNNDQLQGLRTAADLLLHQDPCFQQFERDVNGQPTTPEQKTCVTVP